MTMLRIPTLVSALLLCAALGGCGAIASRAGDRFAGQLGDAVLASDDPATVRDGLPAYLLLIDGLVAGQSPGKRGNAPLLLAAARLNGAYAGNFTDGDAERARRLADKAMDYARRAAALRTPALAAAMDGPVPAFESALAAVPDREVALLYGLGTAWIGRLQANSEDWGAIADLPKVQALLERVAAIDPAYDQGMVRVYLGVLHSLRPEAVGGQPELGRRHFEAAIAISGGRNLQAKVLMAQYYARLVFDQALHDRLLDEVLAADPKAPGLTLMNVLAQSHARDLQASGKDYF